MVYRRRTATTTRKRRSPRRSRRVYGRRKITRRTYRRTSRYPRRARGPNKPPRRNVWQIHLGGSLSPTDPNYHKAFEFDANFNWDGNPTGRPHSSHLLQFAPEGVSIGRRLGQRIFLHGMRFSFGIHTQYSANDVSSKIWQNGILHWALIQLNDQEGANADTQPTFSTPIGSVVGESLVNFKSPYILRENATYGKLKSRDWNVITHRKFWVGYPKTNANTTFQKDIQFYIPIKKMVAFTNDLDQMGSRPFKVMMWYVPSNGIIPTSRVITVSGTYVDVYFKNVN